MNDFLRRFLILSIVLCAPLSAQSYAQNAAVNDSKPARSEVVYRTNLGRALDVKILIEKGASPNETNDAGVPLISLASARSDSEGLEVVKILLASGADINKADARGKTALFHAAKNGNKDVVEYLLANKANYTLTDKSGNTARIAAYQAGNNEIVEVLDNFVRSQNKATLKQGADTTKEIEDKYKAYNEAITEQKKELEDQSKKNISEEDMVKDAVRKAAFASCAMTYWQYCASVQQPTELTPQELMNNVYTQSAHTKEHMNTLVNERRVSKDTVQNIMTVSSEDIRSQLDDYASNDDRRDNGVGTIDDMTKRCSSIAATWDTAIKITAPKKKSYDKTFIR
jgi:ankyrin repeat protein